MLVTRARDTSSYFAFCNLVGGQDELVFDGHSVVLDDAGEVVARAPGFEEHLLVVDIEPVAAIGRRLRDARRRELDRSREHAPAVEVVELAAAPSSPTRSPASVTAVRARARADARARSRSASATTSRRTASPTSSSPSRAGSTRRSPRRSARRRSGRSACTASRCRRGTARRERGATRAPSPSRSAARSARSRSRRSSARSTTRSRAEIDGGLAGLAAENLQARVRGVLLMALSNTYGWLVVSTGNKSELAVGLLDALRRHGRRLRAAEGRVQDGRVPARRAPQRPRRTRRDPAKHDRARTERRAPRRPARLGLDPAVRRARPGARGVRRGGPLARGARSRSSTRPSSTAPSRSSTAPSTSDGRRRPA